ncbi:MAG: hypothetical protein ACKVW3_06010 [Phycisphaerales bacterium]
MRTSVIAHAIAVLSGLGLASSASAQVVQTGGLLKIATGGGSDGFKLIVTAAGAIKLYGVPGVPDGRQYNAVTSVEVRSNDGFDTIEVESFAAVTPALLIDTGTGGSDVFIDLKPSLSGGMISSNVRVIGSAGDDKCSIRLNTAAAVAQNIWDINPGDGVNQTYVLIDSDQPSTRMAFDLRYAGGASYDVINVDCIANANAIEARLGITTGGGADEAIVKVVPLRASAVALNTAISMGSDRDKVTLFVDEVRSSSTLVGSVALGAGDDVADLRFEGRVFSNFVLGAGSEKDFIGWGVKGDCSGSTQLRGGLGDDFIASFIEGSLFGSVSANGGPGLDTFAGRGTPLNCEIID